MQTLKINRCTDPMKWYAGLVGECVPLLGEEPDCFRSVEPAGYTNFVDKSDATVVDSQLVELEAAA